MARKGEEMERTLYDLIIPLYLIIHYHYFHNNNANNANNANNNDDDDDDDDDGNKMIEISMEYILSIFICISCIF